MAVQILKKTVRQVFNAKWRCTICGYKGKATSQVSQEDAEESAAEQERDHKVKHNGNHGNGRRH